MIEQLTEREQQWVQRVSSRHFYAIVIGLVLMVAGGSYAIWGTQQLQPAHPLRLDEAFDRPIARVGRMLAAAQAQRLSAVKPNTVLEINLLRDLRRQTDVSIRLAVTLLRLLFAGMVLSVGLALLTSGLTQKELLHIITKLR